MAACFKEAISREIFQDHNPYVILDIVTMDILKLSFLTNVKGTCTLKSAACLLKTSFLDSHRVNEKLSQMLK